MSKFDSTLTAERCRELFNYDPETGIFTNRIYRNFRSHAGKVIGSPDGKGYLHMRVDYRMYQNHRVAWLWVHGEWPKNHIDHINGIRDDNQIVNLRDVVQMVNQQNRKLPRVGSKSQIMGVRFLKGSWQSRIYTRGKEWVLGYFDTPEEAHQCYLGAKRLLHPGNTL
jgi:hypothetical protein